MVKYCIQNPHCGASLGYQFSAVAAFELAGLAANTWVLSHANRINPTHAAAYHLGAIGFQVGFSAITTDYIGKSWSLAIGLVSNYIAANYKFGWETAAIFSVLVNSDITALMLGINELSPVFFGSSYCQPICSKEISGDLVSTTDQ